MNKYENISENMKKLSLTELTRIYGKTKNKPGWTYSKSIYLHAIKQEISYRRANK